MNSFNFFLNLLIMNQIWTNSLYLRQNKIITEGVMSTIWRHHFSISTLFIFILFIVKKKIKILYIWFFFSIGLMCGCLSGFRYPCKLKNRIVKSLFSFQNVHTPSSKTKQQNNLEYSNFKTTSLNMHKNKNYFLKNYRIIKYSKGAGIWHTNLC